MYKSPIEMLISDIEHQIVEQQDKQIYEAVLHCVPNIDKGELLRALRYDRNQYEKGYADAMAELVRCKNCYYYDEKNPGRGHCKYFDILRADNDFCSSGEER